MSIKKQNLSKGKSQSSNDKYRAYIPFILALATFLLYIQILNFSFTGFDDTVIINDNKELLSNISNLGKVFMNDAFFQDGFQQFFRPLQNLTLLFDTILGNGDLWMYYLTNIILHILVVISLFILLTELDIDYKLSALLSFIFASAPLFNHAVAWVPGRGDVLLGLFSILFLLNIIRFTKVQKTHYLLINYIAFALALLSKESALFLPLIALIIVWIKNKNLITNKYGIISAVTYIILVVCYFLLRKSVIQSDSPEGYFGFEILVNNLMVLPELLGKFIIPINLSPLPNYSLINISIGLVFAMILVYFIFRIENSNVRKLAILSVIWYIIFSIPGMMYKHNFGEFAYDYLEHRAYLPIVGVILLIGIMAKEVKPFANRALIILIIPAVVYPIFSIINSKNYSNDLSLYQRAIDINPDKAAMAYLNRGLINAKSGKQKIAIDDFNLAAQIYPEYPDAYSNRALARTELGEKINILEDYNKAIELNPKNPVFYFNRAIFKAAQGDKNSAIEDYKKALEINPKHKNALRNITYELNQIKDYSGTIEFANKGLTLIGDFDEVLLNRGIAKFYLNDTTGACSDWQVANNLGHKNALDLIKRFCK